MLSFPISPRSGQSYAAPNGQVYVFDGIKWLGTTISGGGGGTTTVTNNIENPFSFSVAADDSTQRSISNNELIKFIGAGTITTSSDDEGNITITGTGGGGTATSDYQFFVAADDSTQRLISTDEVIKFIGTNGITTASDAEGAITISKISELVSVTVPTIGSTASAGEAGITYLSGGLSKWAIFTEGAFTVGEWLDVQPGWTVTDNNGFTDIIAGRGSFGAASFSTTVNDWPSPASGKTYVFTSPGGYQQGYTNPIEITVGSNNWAFGNDGSLTFPNGTVQTTAPELFSFNVAGDDSTQRAIGNNELIKFTGAGGITTSSDAEGYITITQGTTSSLVNGVHTASLGSTGILTLSNGAIATTVDNNATVNTSATVTTNNSYTNTTDFSTDVDPGVGYTLDGWYQRNSEQIEFALFGPAAFQTYLTGLALGRTVIVTYSSGSGNQTITRPLTQIFAETGQTDPNNPTWGRVSGRIDATLPADQTGIVSINFPVYSTESHTWTFGDDGDLTFPDNTVQSTAWTGIAGVARNIESEGDVSIKVNLTDSTQRIWQFGEDGSFTVPNGISSFENFEVKINADDSTLKTFKFNSAGSITLPNSAQIRPSSAAYDEALASWESLRAAEEESLTALGYNELNRPYIAWNVTGENAAEYLAELNRVWQIQGTYPDNGPLVWTPAISSALYNQIRSTLTVVAGDYQSVDNGVSIAVQSSNWETLGKSWNFDEDGKLTFPDGAKYAGQTVTMPTTTNGVPNSFVWEFSDNLVGSDNITLNWNLLASNQGGFYLGTTHSTNGKYLFLDGTDQSLSYVAGGVFGGGKLKFGESTNGGAGGVNDIELKSSTSDVYITANNKSWKFGEGGLLSLGASSGGIYSDQTTGRISIGDGLNPANGSGLAPSNVFYVGGPDFVARISGYSTGISPVWTFNRDLSMQIPGDIRSEGNINIDINLSDSTLRRWTFGEDGELTFPDGTNQSTAFTDNAATIDITDTNGIDTNYYLTFVENRDGGEILRADVDLIFNSADNTLTSGNITTGILKINDGVHEKFQELADATGTVTHDCSAGHIFYHSSPDANWTVNLTNLNLSTGYATTITIIIDQGGTGYYPNALQIGGSAQTINWQGNTTPTPSTNRQDVVSFSILAVSGGYIVFGQLTGF